MRRPGGCLWPGQLQPQVPHLELETAWFYSQCSGCCYAFLFCGGVITTAWCAMCLGPSSLARQEVTELVPRSLEVDREGEKKSIWFLVVLASQELQSLIMRERNKYNPLSYREWLLALWSGVSYAHPTWRGWEQGGSHVPLQHPGEVSPLNFCANKLLFHPQNWFCFFPK